MTRNVASFIQALARRPVRLRAFAAALAALAAMLVPLTGAAGASTDLGWQWWKTDPHVHSSVSGDALQDLGIISEFGKENGYNAMFITDHTATNINPVGGVVADHVKFEDDLNQWSIATYGSLIGSAAALAPSPVFSGTQSLHLAATSGGGSGESFIWNRRGPALRDGDIILQFSVNPTRIDAGSGAFVSVAIGGDATVVSRPPNGYTTQNGVISPGKTTVLVWQLGQARSPSSDPNARVLTYDLPYTLNAWNTYRINVSTGDTTWNGAAVGTGWGGLGDIPAPDRPVDYNGLTMVKLAVRGNDGTVDAYFDKYNLDASNAPTESGSLFVYRNSLIRQYDTASFKLFPGQEMGYSDHANRFNFDISHPAQFLVYNHGSDGVGPTQQTGYPAQINHPALPGGMTQAEVRSSLAAGADAIEAAERGEEAGGAKDVMVNEWDYLLQQNRIIMGVWTSDAHRTEKFGPAQYIYAPTLDFDALLRSYYEGREYMANSSFSGRVLFSLDPTSEEPYPARYPVSISPSQALANVHLQITSGIPSGAQVLWFRNGSLFATDSTSGSSYEGVKSISLSGSSFTYVRAELRSATNARLAMTEPIFFEQVPSLPAGLSYHVAGVTTTDGKGYTRTMTQGITASSYDAGAQTLALTFTNLPGSLVESEARTGSIDPIGVQVEGASVSQAGSRADFDSATGSSWFYDSTAHLLHLKTLQGEGATTSAIVSFTSTGDRDSPSQPTGLTATPGGSTQINLAWNASTDDVGVAGYTVYRNGTPVATVGAAQLAYADGSLTPGTVYTYTVDAFDAATNRSLQSEEAMAQTDRLLTSTFTPVADTYVSASAPTTIYGNSTSLRIDGSPDLHAFLRFNVQGVTGTFQSASLRMFGNAAGKGFTVRPMTNTSWVETGTGAVSYNNQPTYGSGTLGAAPGYSAGSWTTAVLTSEIGNGLVSFALTSTSTAAQNFSAREGANRPQLIVDTTIRNQPPVAGSVSVITNQDTTVSWTPQVSDPNGDSVTCSIASQPSNGTATVAANCSSGTYTPNPGYTGADSFSYTASDGALSSTGDVTVEVKGPNHPPTADDVSMTSDRNTQGSWTPSVSDPDGDPLTCTIATSPANGTATVSANCSSGTYTPNLGFVGSDGFTYRVSDGSLSATASVSVLVVPGIANNAPVAANVNETVTEGSTVAVTLSATDADGDCPLAFAIVSLPAHGSLGLLEQPTCTPSGATTQISYSADSGYTGEDSFTYQVNDPLGATSAPATVTISVGAQNRAPVASDASAQTGEQTPATLTLQAVDPDGACPLSFTILSAPANGTLGALTNQQCTPAGASAQLSYSPNAGFSGSDAFTFKATDAAGADSQPATATITVSPALFSDGFESGSLGAWTSSTGLVVQGGTVHSGSFAARGTTTTGVTWAHKRLGGTYTELTYRLWFRLLSKASTNAVMLLKLRTAADRAIAGVFVDNSRRLAFRNDVTAVNTASTQTIALGTWYAVKLHVRVNGGSSSYDVSLDGTPVPGLSSASANLGTTPIGDLQLGDTGAGRTYDVIFDDVLAELP